MFEKLKKYIDKKHDKCFEQHNKNGVCYGLASCDKWLGNYCSDCIGCKHLTMIKDK